MNRVAMKALDALNKTCERENLTPILNICLTADGRVQIITIDTLTPGEVKNTLEYVATNFNPFSRQLITIPDPRSN